MWLLIPSTHDPPLLHVLFTHSSMSVCKKKMIPELCFYNWKKITGFTLSKIESNVSKCALRELKIAYKKSPFTFKTEFKRVPGRSDMPYLLFGWNFTRFKVLPNNSQRQSEPFFVIFPWELGHFQLQFFPQNLKNFTKISIQFRRQSRVQILLYTGSFKSF